MGRLRKLTTFEREFAVRLKALREKADLLPSHAVAKFNKLKSGKELYPAGITLDTWLSWERTEGPHCRVAPLGAWPAIAKTLGVTPVKLVPRS